MTGKGGVGKTTMAAATAFAAAERGARTLLVSTDAAHSLSDVLDTELGAEPMTVSARLDALHIDGTRELQRSWSAIVEYVQGLLGRTELDRLHIDELMVVPGLEQLVALARLCALIEDDRWAAIIVDCAPSADSLRLLSMPDVFSWYVEQLFPRGHAMSAWVRRRMAESLAIPAPSDAVLSSVERLAGELSRLRSVLTEAMTTARIVVTPERVVIAEGRRTMTYLALYRYAVDAVIVNRAPAATLADCGLSSWVDAQHAQMATLEDSFGSLPRLVADHRFVEPIGATALADIGAQLYEAHDPLARLTTAVPVEVCTGAEESMIRLHLRGAERSELVLRRRGDDLVVGVGPYRSTLTLPDAFRTRDVVRAGVRDEHLEIVFGEPARV